MSFFGIDFLDASLGWTVGFGGQIRHTDDGGLNWETQLSGTFATLYDVEIVEMLVPEPVFGLFLLAPYVIIAVRQRNRATRKSSWLTNATHPATLC